MRVEPVDPFGTMLAEIADKRMTRDDVAMTYAFAIRQHPGQHEGYARVNRAIMDRWSLSALKYIKGQAWRIVEGKS
jgi:hypothetical protein